MILNGTQLQFDEGNPHWLSYLEVSSIWTPYGSNVSSQSRLSYAIKEDLDKDSYRLCSQTHLGLPNVIYIRHTAREQKIARRLFTCKSAYVNRLWKHIRLAQKLNHPLLLMSPRIMTRFYTPWSHSARKLNSMSIFDSVYHISEISLQPPSKVT